LTVTKFRNAVTVFRNAEAAFLEQRYFFEVPEPWSLHDDGERGDNPRQSFQEILRIQAQFYLACFSP